MPAEILPPLTSRARLRSIPRRTAKELIDVFFGLLCLASTLLLVPVVWLGMRLTGDQGPVFYCEIRLGYLMQEFVIWKFRTMRQNMPGPAWTVSRDPRVTRFGYWLRRYRIDELPQGINILLGEMSLVGPRALNLETARQMDEISGSDVRYTVKPGITGPASLARTGRRGDIGTLPILHRMSWHERRYVQCPSLAEDLRIIAKTPLVMLQGRGRA